MASRRDRATLVALVLLGLGSSVPSYAENWSLGTSPYNGQTDVPTNTANLSWGGVPNPVSHDVYFGTTNPPPLVAPGIPANSWAFPAPLEDCRTYYWKIVTHRTPPLADYPSPVRTFTTCAEPSPANGQAGVCADAVLDWEDVSGASSYDVYFGAGGLPPTATASGILLSTWTPLSPLSFGTTYHWRVDAKNAGGVFDTSSVRSFGPCNLILADMNYDGSEDAFDVEPFHNALCVTTTGCCAAGDFDFDGAVNAFDIVPFIHELFGEGGPLPPGTQQGIRLYFDTDAGAVPGGIERDRLHPKQDVPSRPTSQSNPVLSTGTQRLYIYAQYLGTGQKLLATSFNVEVDGGTIAGAYFYDKQDVGGIGLKRWSVVEPAPAVVLGSVPQVEFKAATVDQLGAGNAPLHVIFDPQFGADGPRGSTLLGYVDVSASGPASVWLTAGDCGMAIATGVGKGDSIFFGFGDAPLTMDQANVRTLIADATFVTNTPASAPSIVAPGDPTTKTTPVTLTFDNVTAPGLTSLTTSPVGPTPPAGFSLGSPATYYDIATTATFNGNIQVCVSYAGVSYPNENNLKLFHYDGAVWQDVTVSLDTVNDVICGLVTSLSPFAVFEQVNLPPVPDFSYQQLTDIGSTVAVQLDASASYDPDDAVSPLGFTWFVDGVEDPGCAASQCIVDLGFGSHEIRLVVTDALGASAELTANVTLDPAVLSVLEIDRARVRFNKNPPDLTLHGQIGLPLGVNYSELSPQATVTAALAGVTVLPATPLTLTVQGNNGKQWKFDAPGQAPGVAKLHIDWKGSSYRFRDPPFPLELSSDLITTSETVLEIKHKIKANQPLAGPFTVSIGGQAQVTFDAAGNVTASDVPYEVGGKRVSLTLPFPLTESTVIGVSGSLSRQINVADDLKASVGRYRLEARFAAALLPDGAASTPRTVELNLTIGAEHYPGAATPGCELDVDGEHRWGLNDCCDDD